MMCKHFYRVTVTLDEGATLAFDFKTMEEAGVFADAAFCSCDIYIVKIDIVEMRLIQQTHQCGGNNMIKIELFSKGGKTAGTIQEEREE